MKTRFLFVVVVCVWTSSQGIAQNPWKWIAPDPPRLPQCLSTVAIGTKAYFWCASNAVFSTSDSGNTFTAYPQYGPVNNTENGFYPMEGIAFADSLTGYIVDLAHGEFRTTDGGWTWEQKGGPGSNTVVVVFGSSEVGWKAGGAGFYKTTNAGQTWTFSNIPVLGTFPNFDGRVSKMCAFSASDLWVLKTFQYDTLGLGPLWHSTDGGSSWTNLVTGLISDSLNQITYENLEMRPSGFGCITGTIYTPSLNFDNIRGFALATTDFGVTWAVQYFPNEDYGSITCVNDSVWVLLGNTRPHSYDAWGQSIERRTTDHGTNWTFSPVFGSERVQFLHFYASVYIPPLHTILATTTSGTYRSSDGGETFRKLTSPNDILVSFVALDNQASSATDQMVVCPSYGADYLLSTDGGSVWTPKHLPGYLPVNSHDIQVVNGRIYAVVGPLAYSDDLGNSWSWLDITQSLGVLRGLSVSDKGVILVDSYPNMAMSQDDGKTWSLAPLPGSFWVNASEVVGQEGIIAVGGFYQNYATKGFIYLSTDKGFDWRMQDFPSEMLQISMISQTTGVAIGADSKLYRTTDGGSTWKVALEGVNAYAFFDSLRGISSDLRITSDGGATWVSSGLSLPPVADFTSMEFNKAGDLFASGRGNLFKYPDAIAAVPTSSSSTQPDIVSNTIMLQQNTPNPFNPSTTISFSLPTSEFVQLKVYDMLGREVKNLVEGVLAGGKHSVSFEGSALPSGVYFYRLTVAGNSSIRKMVLVR